MNPKQAEPDLWVHPTVGAVLHLRTSTLHKCAAVSRRARIQGLHTFAALNSRLESNNEEEEEPDLWVDPTEFHLATNQFTSFTGVLGDM